MSGNTRSWTTWLRRDKVKTYLRKIVRFINDEDGATGAEYALLITLVALAIIVGVGALGTSISGMYNNNASRVAAALPE
jgi:pilus assembly protein Flp/PilA